MLTYKYKNDDDELGMILSNNVDMGNSQGGLISVKAFKSFIEDIKKWRINKNKRSGMNDKQRRIHEKVPDFNLVVSGEKSDIGYFQSCAAVSYHGSNIVPCSNGHYFDDKKGQRWQVRKNKWVNTEYE